MSKSLGAGEKRPANGVETHCTFGTPISLASAAAKSTSKPLGLSIGSSRKPLTGNSAPTVSWPSVWRSSSADWEPVSVPPPPPPPSSSSSSPQAASASAARSTAASHSAHLNPSRIHSVADAQESLPSLTRESERLTRASDIKGFADECQTASAAPGVPASGDPNRAAEQILAAASRAIQRRGFASTRIADIAREAGMSTGAIHYYFDVKDEVLIAALKWASERLFDRLDVLAPAPRANASGSRRSSRWRCRSRARGAASTCSGSSSGCARCRSRSCCPPVRSCRAAGAATSTSRCGAAPSRASSSPWPTPTRSRSA